MCSAQFYVQTLSSETNVSSLGKDLFHHSSWTSFKSRSQKTSDFTLRNIQTHHQGGKPDYPFMACDMVKSQW